MKTALEKACEMVGGQSALARMLGVKQQNVHNWLVRGVPASRAADIEQATGGKVKCRDLCPAVFRR